eukprot:9472607-Pyramimonas_sp.AAC.1
MCADAVVPAQGILAGSSTATYEIKCYCLPTVAEYCECRLHPELAVHVDDFSLNERNEDLEQCVVNMGFAVAFLVD